MSYYQFSQTQKIPSDIETVWDFISNPANLKLITPGYMRFEMTGPKQPEKMYPGMIITYIVCPVMRIPMKWVTEITHVENGKYFVDEQRIGPYALWHHQHKIESIEGGVLMTDIITYAPPYGFLGALANKLFIRKKLNQIFSFRTKAIEQKFGIFSKV